MKPYLLSDMFKLAGVNNISKSADHIEIRLPPTYGDETMTPNVPRPDQVAVLNMALKTNRFGNYSEPGVGKTVVAQAFALYWIFEGEKCLVVMPPILLGQFQESLSESFIGSEDFIECHLLDDAPKARERLFTEWKEKNSWPQVLLVSYEMFLKLHADLKGVYNVLIPDEAQNLKNHESKTFAAVEEILGRWDDTILHLMTGTPAHRDLMDTYALIKLTNPGAYGGLRDFQSRHCVYKKFKLKEPKEIITKGGKKKKITSFTKLAGFKNIGELNKNLYKNAVRITKDKVSKLDPPVIHIVPVKLSKDHKALYDKLSKERVLELEDRLISALEDQALRQKLLQIVTFPELFVDPGVKIQNNILEGVDEIIDGIDMANTKVIVFANYKQSVKYLAERYKQYNPAILNGDISDKEAQKQKFLKDPTCRMLVANPESAGVGLNLQSVCHNIIFAEPTAIPGDFKQAMDRVFRTGQFKRVNVWILKALKTLSPKAIESMMAREGAIQAVNRDRESLLNVIVGG